VISKVVIPAAGLGTRLFPVTKENPKEMLPIFSKIINGGLVVKPVVQVVFEQLYDVGLREFCYIVGRGKRGIEDHFTPDLNCISALEYKGKNGQAYDLKNFYKKLETSRTMWINQSEPKGLGNAVLMAAPFVQNQCCVVHAGDSWVISKNMDYLKKLLDTFERFKLDATFIVLEVENPIQYGIVEGEEIKPGIIKVEALVEKPERPKTNWAIIAAYVFKPIVFKALEKTLPGKNGEVQLTDAIQKLVDWGLKVYAIKLDRGYSHIDIGSPERYWQALELSHKYFHEG